MKIPADLYGRNFADHLIRVWQFQQIRQRGSHIVLATELPIKFSVSIPAHKPLRKGTLRSLLVYIAERKCVSIEQLLERL